MEFARGWEPHGLYSRLIPDDPRHSRVNFSPARAVSSQKEKLIIWKARSQN